MSTSVFFPNKPDSDDTSFVTPATDFIEADAKSIIAHCHSAPPSSSQYVCESPSAYFPGRLTHENNQLTTYHGKNRLPHWELDATIYHVCLRLYDSVPQEKLEFWLRERLRITNIARQQQRELTEKEREMLQFLYSDTITQYLISGHGECLLRIPRIAQTVKGSLEFYNDVKYELHGWCIMPNHVHAAFKLLNRFQLNEVISGWKSFTAHRINKLLGRTGHVWQADYYNHIFRTENEYYRQIRYIWHNPDKANMPNWPWRWMCLDDMPKQSGTP